MDDFFTIFIIANRFPIFRAIMASKYIYIYCINFCMLPLIYDCSSWHAHCITSIKVFYWSLFCILECDFIHFIFCAISRDLVISALSC